RGDGSLHRVVVAAWRVDGDDQLLPLVRANAAEDGRSEHSPHLSAHVGHLGTEGSLPRPRARHAREHGCPQGSRRAPSRCIALGPSRRARARESTAHRFLSRRTVMKKLYAVMALTAALASDVAAAPTPTGIKNVVLVHGAFADGSGWEAVANNLTKD